VLGSRVIGVKLAEDLVKAFSALILPTKSGMCDALEK